MEGRIVNGLAGTILKDLQADVHSGATDITRKAVGCLAAYCDDSPGSTPAYWKKLVDLGRQLIAAQPSMASLFNLVNHVLLRLEPLYESSPLAALRQATRDAAQQFQRSSEAALDALAQHGQGLITPNCTVFTHSSSTTVVGILRQALRQGKSLGAIATESRPYCEGREMARSLGQQGIHTRLILDAAITQYVKQADLIVLGVDRISEETFVNKVGTLAIAQAAKNEQVPLYLACESSKFLPAAYSPQGDVLGSSEQTDQEEWQNVELVYSFFEEAPTSYITGIITEEGILSLNAVAKRFKAFRVSKELIKTEAS